MTELPFATATELDSRSTDKDQAIRQASGLVRSLVRWHVFPSLSETFRLDGSGSDTLLLPTLRLTDVTQVRNDGTVVDVTWSRTGVVRRSAGRFTTKQGGVEVDVAHGYAQVPVDLADVVMALAERILDDPTLAKGNERLGDYSVGYGDLSQIHRRVLADYAIGSVS